MKNNKYLFIFLVFIFLFALVGCKDKVDENEALASDLQEKFNQSLNSAKKLVISYEAKDEELVVYENIITLIFDENNKENAQLIVKESVLNNKFVLESDSTSSDLTGVNRDDYLHVTFEKKYFEEMAKDNNLIKLVVKSYFLESYLGYQDMTNLGKSANSEVTVEENLISSIVTKYISDSKKDITISMSFSY